MERAAVTTAAETIAGPPAPSQRPARGSGASCASTSLTAFAILALVYLMLPIAVVILFSFNDPVGRFNFTWQGFSLDAWLNPFGFPDSGRRSSSRS